MTNTTSTSSSAGIAMPANGVSRSFRHSGCLQAAIGRLHGLYELNGHRLYVNRGLGWSALPVRWNCEPEIWCSNGRHDLRWLAPVIRLSLDLR